MGRLFGMPEIRVECGGVARGGVLFQSIYILLPHNLRHLPPPLPPLPSTSTPPHLGMCALRLKITVTEEYSAHVNCMEAD